MPGEKYPTDNFLQAIIISDISYAPSERNHDRTCSPGTVFMYKGGI